MRRSFKFEPRVWYAKLEPRPRPWYVIPLRATGVPVGLGVGYAFKSSTWLGIIATVIAIALFFAESRLENWLRDRRYPEPTPDPSREE